jgi:hypothetical protein
LGERKRSGKGVMKRGSGTRRMGWKEKIMMKVIKRGDKKRA